MTRPALLTESAILLLGSAVLEPLRNAPGARQIGSLLFNLATFVLVSFFLWKGHNWARWITFVICCLCLLELFGLNQQHSLGMLVSTIYDTGLAVFLVFFLNTPPVRRWFTGKTPAVPPPPIPENSDSSSKWAGPSPR